MKIVIASDSYKGTNTSWRVASLIEEGIVKVVPQAQITKVPVADGGEGTVDAILTALDGEEHKVMVKGPLWAPKEALWGSAGDTAVMEMAEASGLPILKGEELNPLKATTYGTGEMIREALDRGFRKIIIGIGGSATNDGGMGMAQALGARFYDSEGKEIPEGAGGGDLARVAQADLSGLDPRLTELSMTVACDVTNPLLGKEGATYTYGKQKGATPEMQKELEGGLASYADILAESLGEDYRNKPGAGAAGGLGFGLVAICGAEIRSGIKTILDFIGLDEHIKEADLVITGEGKIDGQSLYGKVPVGIAERCQPLNKPLLAIVGDIGPGTEKAYELGIDSIMSTVNKAMPLKDALDNSSELLVEAAERAMRMIMIGTEL
ncbi:MAG: glycerate kinase [Spirochaetales bacterium]|nr:glycerate kinase [Spirochaetales bacterium]